MSSPSANASAPPTAATSPLLFAALEAKGTAAYGSWNTMAIAGLDGYARAKTTFIPMPKPYVGCAGAVLPQSARVAAGKVYFADGTGVVRSLATNGQINRVATFPMTSSQQMLSFAVSPDGSRLLAAILTWPPKPSGADPCNRAPVFAAGDFSYDIYIAHSGGSSQLLSHQTFPQSSTQLSPNIMELAGWDAVGPFGTYPSLLASQGGGPTHYFGTPVRIDATTGSVTKSISDSCGVSDIASSGDYVCADSAGAISVRRPDGSEIWHVPGASLGNAYEFLSPDEMHVVVLGPGVYSRNGSSIKLLDNTYFDGWLDSSTVIGGGGSYRGLIYVSLTAPTKVVDIGFTGWFVGTVQP